MTQQSASTALETLTVLDLTRMRAGPTCVRQLADWGADGLGILRRMAARADVVVENYRPDVKKRLGIDYETLSRVNPRLVYASISGFGQDGPYRDQPGGKIRIRDIMEYSDGWKSALRGACCTD